MYRERFVAEQPEWLGRIVASVTEKMPQFRWRVWTKDSVWHPLFFALISFDRLIWLVMVIWYDIDSWWQLLTSRVDLVNDEKNLNGLQALEITEPRRLEAHRMCYLIPFPSFVRYRLTIGDGWCTCVVMLWPRIVPNLILKHRGMFGPRTQGMMVQEEANE
jgi:hypothetical protein